jgi:photosystem II stability/assembly factor-like uncharacterized protein
MAAIRDRTLALCLALTSVLGSACDPTAESAKTVAGLGKYTHIHGIAVAPTNTSPVLLATHDGISSASPDGLISRVSQDGFDFAGFDAHPADREVLFASGHPKNGGNLAFMLSRDAGKTWNLLSTGSTAQNDVHHIAVSRTDPQTIFATNSGLQMSRDGGITWNFVAPLPDGFVDLAASSIDRDRLYAATEQGLLFSTDSGVTWRPAHAKRSLTTLVQGAADRAVFAFIPGVGLLRAKEPSLQWVFISNDFAGRALLHLAIDSSDPRRLYAVTDEQQVVASYDKGVSWARFGESRSVNDQ